MMSNFNSEQQPVDFSRSFFDRVDPTIRIKLDELFDQDRFDEIGTIPGIAIVQRAESFKGVVDCCVYALAMDGRYVMDRLDEVLKLSPVQDPQPGDYVLYFDDKGVSQHVGILLPGGMVRSKWNFGHVYDHPGLLVPLSFGSKIRIVRE